MHADELLLDEATVHALLRSQFPDLIGLPIRRVEAAGTVHAVFRVGDDLAVRLPRRDGPTSPGSREMTWLPRIAAALPVEVPMPVAQGHPDGAYPWFWEIHRWVAGITAPVESLDAVAAARDLAAVVAALRDIDPTGAPRGRGVPLAEREREMHDWFERWRAQRGDRRVHDVWARAVAADPWIGPPVWQHGDLDARNWLVRDSRISGVIDWGSMGVGDPACDVMVAWKLGSAAARDAFRAALPVDVATWKRAHGWVVSQAVAILVYYTQQNNPRLVHEAERWLAVALLEE